MHHCQNCGHPNEPTARYCGHCGRDLSIEPSGVSRIGSTILGRYTIRRLIAAGGMGAVYEADQLLGDHSRTIAIKMLLPELSQDKTVSSRFTRECEIVAQLSHQNTIRVYDFGETEDGTLFIAMEYVRGPSLSKVMSQGPMPLARALCIVEQMCYALHEAHELGIVHRDLKPDNVILTEHGTQKDFVKLLDFGIAARISKGGMHETKLTQQGMFLGTPPYMSPEQFTGAPVRRQSDIYSIGIILYEALAGRLPFEASTPWMWAQRHLTATVPDMPATLSPRIVTAIRSLLAKDPMERPSTTLDVIQSLVDEEASNSRRASHAMSSAVANRTEAAIHTQPDADSLSIGSNVVFAPPRDVAERQDTPITEPVMASVVNHAASVQTNPDPKPRSVQSMIRMAPAHSSSTWHSNRRKPWTLIVFTSLALGLLGFGLWLAYWYDLIESPFDSDAPPLPVAATPTATGDPANGGYQNQTLESVRIAPPLTENPTLPAVGVAARRTSNNNTPIKSSSTLPGTSSAPPAAQPPASASSVGWPSSWPGLPSNMPSLPSSVPPLPSSILGIPLPPLFQAGPVAPSSSAPPPSPSAPLR